MRKIRVLWFVGGEHRKFEKPAHAMTGAQTTTLEIFKNIDQERFSLHCAIDGFTPLAQEFEQYSELIPFRSRRQFDRNALRRIKEIIANGKIDIVHTQGMRRSFLVYLLGEYKNLKKVITRHIPYADEFMPKMKKVIYDPFDRCSIKTADAIVVVAEYAKRRIVETRGIAPERIRVIHNGIDIERFNPKSVKPEEVRDKFSISPGSKVITVIASLTERKGHKYLLRSAVDVLRQHRKAVFLLVGDGYYKTTLEQLAEKLGIRKSCIFAGFRKEVESILGISDVLVLPSLSEGFPDVILEAMAMKVPVIATKIAGIPEMIKDGENGFLIPTRSTRELTAGLVSILGDQDKANLMGERNRKKIITKFTNSVMTESYECLYEELFKI